MADMQGNGASTFVKCTFAEKEPMFSFRLSCVHQGSRDS